MSSSLLRSPSVCTPKHTSTGWRDTHPSPPNGMNPLHFSDAPQKGRSRPSHTQITIEGHSKSRTDQSPQGQFSFPAHGKVPEGPLPSASLTLLATCTTTLPTFLSAACFRIPSPLYPNLVTFPATPLPPRHVQLVARTTTMFSHRLPPRPTERNKLLPIVCWSTNIRSEFDDRLSQAFCPFEPSPLQDLHSVIIHLRILALPNASRGRGQRREGEAHPSDTAMTFRLRHSRLDLY
jgi:hypothetical protein